MLWPEQNPWADMHSYPVIATPSRYGQYWQSMV